MKKICLILVVSLFYNTTLFADKNMKIGFKGKLSDVTRTIEVKMYDN